MDGWMGGWDGFDGGLRRRTLVYDGTSSCIASRPLSMAVRSVLMTAVSWLICSAGSLNSDRRWTNACSWLTCPATLRRVKAMRAAI